YEGVLTVIKARQHDMAALHEAHRVAARLAQAFVEHLLYPRPGRVDEGARVDFLAVREPGAPCSAVAARRDAFGAHDDARAPASRVERICDHEPRIVDPAIRIDKAALQPRLQARGIRPGVEPHGLRSRQQRATRKMVIQKEAEADHPPWPQPGHMRYHEVQGPGEVRCRAKE